MAPRAMPGHLYAGADPPTIAVRPAPQLQPEPALPRVFDDFDDGDARLNATALLGASRAHVGLVQEHTVVMVAATPPIPRAAPGTSAATVTTRSSRRVVIPSERPSAIHWFVAVVGALVVVATVATVYVSLA